ncbi:hypothetical protein Hypma_004618 [Hypsizygus marmoreus]|uniref:Uncharacterized protein n=1 Tax=Hypsizygus marmoreus TaxID=39966 RepID=A0A369K8B9_HYPMA|nr:hypothetical protein Hypma_004618 [Hypsizygus marmoreus]
MKPSNTSTTAAAFYHSYLPPTTKKFKFVELAARKQFSTGPAMSGYPPPKAPPLFSGRSLPPLTTVVQNRMNGGYINLKPLDKVAGMAVENPQMFRAFADGGIPRSGPGYQFVPQQPYPGDTGIRKSILDAPDSLTLAPMRTSPAHYSSSETVLQGLQVPTSNKESGLFTPGNPLLRPIHQVAPRFMRQQSSPVDDRVDSESTADAEARAAPPPVKAPGRTRKNNTDPEDRRRILEAEIWTCEVMPRSVRCRACKKLLQLEKRYGYVYYSANWDRHRDKCRMIKLMEGHNVSKREPREKKREETAPKMTVSEAVGVGSSNMGSCSDTLGSGTSMDPAGSSSSATWPGRTPQAWLSRPGIAPPKEHFGYSEDSSMSVHVHRFSSSRANEGAKDRQGSPSDPVGPPPAYSYGDQQYRFSMRYEFNNGFRNGNVAERAQMDADLVMAEEWMASMQLRSRPM